MRSVLLAVSVVVVPSRVLFGQITFEREDCFDVGDCSNARASEVGALVPLPTGVLGRPGENDWDFTPLTAVTPRPVRYDNVETSDGGFGGEAIFPGADFAVRSTDLDASAVEGWQYFSKTPAGRFVHGVYLGSVRPPEQADPAIVLVPPYMDYRLPMTVGENWTVESTYNVVLTVMGSPINTVNEITYSYQVDAWGRITLPGLGTVDCLRIHELRRQEVFVDFLGDPLLLDTLQTRSYIWVAENADEVARISSETHSQTLGPPGAPPASFTTASFVQLQTENCRIVFVPPSIDPVGDQLILEVDVPYSLQVTADGTPAPSFELTSAPAGMTIGAASGLIEWTPSGAAAGSHTVTVEAENAAGSDSETFTVRVVNTNEPPRNLRSDFVSDGAVDLSWEPPAHVLLLSGYEVRRSLLPGGPYAPVGEVLPGTTTFRDPTPVDGAASYYVVAALLTLGGEFSSAPSNEVSSYVLLKGEMVLSHDDGSAESALVVGGQNSEKAIELQTEPAGSFRLTKVAVFIADFDGVPLTLKVYNADNGPRPGTTREQFTYQPRDLGPGWNILDVPEILQPEYGAGQRFFVGVVEGATNNAVGLDEDSAGHSWTRVAGGEWSFLTGGELMVRAILLGAGGSVRWRRGDANADGNQELSDAVFIFNFLFVGGRPPSCESAADVNRDFRIDLSDGVSLLNFLFIGGAMPRDPFVSCGTALDPRELNCAAYDRCG